MTRECNRELDPRSIFRQLIDQPSTDPQLIDCRSPFLQTKAIIAIGTEHALSKSVFGKTEDRTCSIGRSSEFLNPIEFPRGNTMLSWALTFLVIALIAGVLGFGVVAGTAASIAKVLFVVFLIAFVISLVTGRRAI